MWNKGFLSLKWRLLWVIGLVLVAVNAVFPLLSYISLSDQLHEQLDEDHVHLMTAFDAEMEQAKLHLQQIGGLLPGLSSVSAALGKNNNALEAALDDHWTALQLNFDLRAVGFYSKRGQLVTARGAIQDLQGSNLITRAVNDAIRDELPHNQMYCAQDCIILSAVPLLSQQGDIGAVVLSASLAELALDFRRASAAEIGILVADMNSPGADEEETTRRLDGWQMRVVALTNAAETWPILRKLANERRSLDEVLAGANIDIDERAYALRFVPLSKEPGSLPSHLITITDVTDAMVKIRSAAMQSIVTGILGLLISGTVVLLYLRRPMERLRNTASSLPLLAQSQFDQSRKLIGAQHLAAKPRDEIEQLCVSALALADHLQTLEQQVDSRSRDLQQKIKELARERDFAEGLLATAQVIIITLDNDLRVRLLNQHAASLIGYDSDELIGKSFIELLVPPEEQDTYTRLLRDVSVGHDKQLQHESSILCKDGGERDIVWLYSHLKAEGPLDPGVLAVGLDITERKQVERRFTWLAEHDSLTGLFNRGRLQEELHTALLRAQRHGHSGALFYIDLDYFKDVNDTSGHKAGDQLLRAVAQALQRELRKVDVVARLGGDEFAVVIPEIDELGALALAVKLSDALRAVSITADSTVFTASASIGIALFPAQDEGPEQILANADLAMYQAKDAGRGQWHLFSGKEGARHQVRAQIHWRRKIEDALTQNRFVLHYQPILNLKTQRISHYEALLRMCEAGGSFLRPGAFIREAERTGLIRSIDHWVMTEVITHLSQWERDGQLSYSLNLSARAFDDPELLPLLDRLLIRTGVDPERLIFEITETLVLTDATATRKLMEAIKDKGCYFALDDFGVGFSSFKYLKELPFDYIKIDGSFIRNLVSNRDDQVLVKAFCDVARGFGKKTVAEYVEDAETLAMLSDYKFDLAQGYHVGMPSAQVAVPV